MAPRLARRLAVLVAAPEASAPPCSLETATAVVRATKLRIPPLGAVDPKLVSPRLCFDFTRDGRRDLALEIHSGGTAGNVGWAVFVRTPMGGWRVGRTGSGYELGLVRAGDAFEVVQPVYRRADPNCCPTGGFDHTRYRWNGKRFVVVREYHTKTFSR